MSVLYVGRNEVVVEVQALAQVGEEMYLQGGRIAKGSIGRVMQVLGQSGGFTRLRMQIVKGRILPKRQRGVEKGAEPSQEFFDHPGADTASQRFRRRRPTQQDGGTAWFADRDPRPRRGPNSNVVQTPYNFNPPPQQHNAPQEERWTGGATVEVRPSGGVASIIADPSLQPRGGGGDYVPPSEFAKGMGVDIDYGEYGQEGANQHGTRKSDYRDQWVAPEGDPSGPLMRADGQFASPMREHAPQRALQSQQAVDPFDPSVKPNLDVHRSYQQQQLENLQRGGK